MLRSKSIKGKIPDVANLALNPSLNTKINEVKGETPSISNLATKAAVTTINKSWIKIRGR